MPDDLARFKEEVKNKVDIAEVIGEYVDLRRRGSAITGLCPFHTEKTPSFNVNRDGQFYHCFGCGKGGDVFSFLMDINGMSFMEALEHLAERAGLEMPRKGAYSAGSRELADRIIAANLAAAEYFHRTLGSEEGKPGADYLHGRELAPAVIRSFRLGYAPENPSGLLAFAKSKKVSADDLDSAGILVKSKYGGAPFSRFGGRVIFPIIDPAARILGFGGRILSGEGAKYVNSPETPVYHKSRVLFGMYQAKAAMKKLRAAIVVEGYMDVISLHQAGITNVIAASGTAFTAEQGRIISRMARSVTLLFDGDRAGLSAAARGKDALLPIDSAIEGLAGQLANGERDVAESLGQKGEDSFLATDLSITICVLPGGHDPDSYVRENGADALRAYLERSMGIWEFKLLALSEGESVGPEDRIRLAGEIADSIALIPEGLKRDIYIKDLSSKLGIDIEAMRKAVAGRLKRRGAKREAPAPSGKETGDADRFALLASVLKFPELAREFMLKAGAKPFAHPAVRRVAEEVYRQMKEGTEVNARTLMSALTDPEAQRIIAAASVMELDEKTAAKNISSYFQSFAIGELRAEHDELGRKMLAERDGRKRDALQNRQTEVKDALGKLMGDASAKPRGKR